MSKRNIFTWAAIIIITQTADAQTWNEWFAQKKTKKEYLLQQIAALQVYTGYLQQGYEIARKGLNVINDIRHGDFDLHNAFFNSFKEVNSTDSSCGGVTCVLDFSSSIQIACNNAVRSLDGDKNLASEEKTYLHGVFTAMLEGTTQVMEELENILSDDHFEMNDKERLEKIETLCNDVKDKYAFVRSFQQAALVLSAQRAHEQTEIGKSKKLNEVQ